MGQRDALAELFKSIGAKVDTSTPGKIIVSDSRVREPERPVMRPVPQNIIKALNSANAGSMLGILAEVMRAAAQTPGRKTWRVPAQALGKLTEALRGLNAQIGNRPVTMRAVFTSKKPVSFFLWPETADPELQTVFQIIHASGAGTLDRLKACDNCGRFFMARRDVDRFCTTKCRNNWHSKTPDGRKLNRERQRRYREFHY